MAKVLPGDKDTHLVHPFPNDESKTACGLTYDRKTRSVGAHRLVFVTCPVCVESPTFNFAEQEQALLSRMENTSARLLQIDREKRLARRRAEEEAAAGRDQRVNEIVAALPENIKQAGHLTSWLRSKLNTLLRVINYG